MFETLIFTEKKLINLLISLITETNYFISTLFEIRM